VYPKYDDTYDAILTRKDPDYGQPKSTYYTGAQDTATHKGATFAQHIRYFITTYPDLYNAWMSRSDALYQNGYYKDPIKVPCDQSTDCPVSSYPAPAYSNYGASYDDSYNPYPGDAPCYQNNYYCNDYSSSGYDAQGYDPYGYDQSGYHKDDGYSKYGRQAGSAYNASGYFQNAEYADRRVKFDQNGKPYTTPAGEVLRYDAWGYDQYGYDKYGNPKYPSCPDNNTPPPPNRNPPGNSSLNNCDVAGSEEMVAGKVHYIRKSTAQMSSDDWTRFRAAWNGLNDMGWIRNLTSVHSGAFQQHNTVKFGPWHREFVARLEDELHNQDPCVFLPYWDVVANPSLPGGINVPGFPPDVKTIAADGVTVLSSSPVTRAVGVSGALPTAGIQTNVLATAQFPTFSLLLEQFHNSVHVYVGGDMGVITTAPKDPAFYLHHANIDRLWDLWSSTHAGEPSAAVIGNINPLTFGDGDTKAYTDEDVTAEVVTLRGAGYKYV